MYGDSFAYSTNFFSRELSGPQVFHAFGIALATKNKIKPPKFKFGFR